MKVKKEDLLSNSKTKLDIFNVFLDRLFFKLLLLFLPTQLSTHFFFDFSLVMGLRIDYYSLQIMFTDILLFLTLLFWFLRKGKNFYLRKLNRVKKTHLLILIIFLVSNFLFAASKELFLLKILKFIELSLLVLYIYLEKISLRSTFYYLLISSCYSSLIALIQFLKQASLGGFFWFLGERSFSFATPGIAKTSIFGRSYLRPYSTFPHPNALAGFLALILPLLTFFSAYAKTKKEEKILIFIFFPLFIIALFLTFSRTGILTALFGLLGVLFLLKKKQTIPLSIILLFLLIIFSKLLLGRFYNLFFDNEETLIYRYKLFQASLKLFSHHPLFGIGLNNFIKMLPDTSLLQPVHNTYFLILTETGLIGFTIFISFLFEIYKKISRKFSILTIIFYQILFLLFFDHYFYTLQQNQLLFTILISFMIKKKQIYV